MRLLLDTHAFLWFIMGSANLRVNARALIETSANERGSLHTNSLMALKLSTLSALTVLLLTFQITSAQQTTTKVSATAWAYRDTNDDLVYRISYDYELAGRNSVFIDNIGEVPARGRFAYFSYDSNLVFRDSRSGRVLASFSLLGAEAWTSVGSRPDFPDESEFPKTYRSGAWTFASSFQMIANVVLNKSFPSGYRAYSANDLNYIHTTYAALKDLSPNLLGEIAVLLSQPYDAESKRFYYHIQFVVHEKRIQSGQWRSEISDETRKSAEKFIDGLIAKLEDEARRRR
jgi:hypothetical protein